jgi:hypothetical protein
VDFRLGFGRNEDIMLARLDTFVRVSRIHEYLPDLFVWVSVVGIVFSPSFLIFGK